MSTLYIEKVKKRETADWKEVYKERVGHLGLNSIIGLSPGLRTTDSVPRNLSQNLGPPCIWYANRWFSAPGREPVFSAYVSTTFSALIRASKPERREVRITTPPLTLTTLHAVWFIRNTVKFGTVLFLNFS